MRTTTGGSSSYVRARIYANIRAVCASENAAMLLQDRAGLAVTCAGPEALEAFNQVLWAGVSYVQRVFPLAERAVALDEGLVLGHCLLVSAHNLGVKCMKKYVYFPAGLFRTVKFPPSQQPPRYAVRRDHYKMLHHTFPPVSHHVRIAKAAVEGGGLTEREERHVQALLAYADGQLPTAIDHWAAILVKYPRDLLAVHTIFVSCKMLGMFARARDTLAAVLPHWKDSDPLFPYLLAL